MNTVIKTQVKRSRPFEQRIQLPSQKFVNFAALPPGVQLSITLFIRTNVIRLLAVALKISEQTKRLKLQYPLLRGNSGEEHADQIMANYYTNDSDNKPDNPFPARCPKQPTQGRKNRSV